MKISTKRTVLMLLFFAFACGVLMLFGISSITVFAHEQNETHEHDNLEGGLESLSGYVCNNGVDFQVDLSEKTENYFLELTEGFGCANIDGTSREDGYSSSYPSGCRNWQVMPIISPMFKYWIDESTLSSLTPTQRTQFIADVDGAAAEWNSVRINDYSGLDGNGYEIKNMFIEIPSTKFGNDDYRLYGFFSMISNGKVKNLKLTDIYIHGNTQHEGGYTFVGGIAGSNFFSTITNSSVSGYMYVYRYNSLMGGIVGANQGSRIENCIVNMTISSYGEVGGITGVSDYSVIDNCKFYGTINWRYANKDNFGFNNAGGIVGRAAAGKILNSKNYGAIQYDGISTESRTLQPCIAEIVGYTESGVTLSGNGRYGSVSWGNLKKVTWKTGIWPFRTTHNHIQYQYVTTSQVGYSA